ncbi:hypothetical protein CesoFtcFv8_022710 [Champsocephalus esox]|uniref:BUB1 N-terminal domain-containing protein n=1 Tax=Champsocephalus esox TaxID=159716 RepID=A0AAN8GJ17_9TELE|nr:hypothetical protein CesoFtcFv8_022710 [Champsocephalus esox]
MDTLSYIQLFEESMNLYTGDDPLDPWGSFVVYLESQDGGRELPQALDRLVQEFLNVEKYANDIRYVNYCIRCASFYAEPVAVYDHVFSKGVGTRTAALYVSWRNSLSRTGRSNRPRLCSRELWRTKLSPEKPCSTNTGSLTSDTKSRLQHQVRGVLHLP